MRRVSLFMFLGMLCWLYALAAYALPFSVTVKAGTKLPTYVPRGASALAYYTVRNQTNSIRVDNFVKYLPPNVTQVLRHTNAADPCDVNFSLTPRGTPGDSCTLTLKITGAVSASDRSPSHHLFVCFPGGITCAGTPNPLNVRVVNVPPPNVRLVAITVIPDKEALQVGSTRQYTAIGRYSDSTLLDISNQVLWQSSQPAIASITATGLATAISNGTTTISATLSGIVGTASLKVKNVIAYISDMTTDKVYYCNVPPVGGTLNCTDAAVPNLDEPQGIAVNQAGTKAYIVNCDSDPFAVMICDITAGSGALTNCVSAYAGTSSRLVGIALNQAETQAFLTNNQGANSPVISCDIDPSTGKLINCNNNVETIFNQPQGIALNNFGPQSTRAYIMNQIDTPAVCSINPTTGLLFDCSNPNPPSGGVNSNVGIAINATGTFAYISSPGTNVVYACSIAADGDFSVCTAFPGSGTFNFPFGVSLTPDGKQLYVANNGSNTISICPVAATGSLGGCSVATPIPSITTPAFIAFGLVG